MEHCHARSGMSDRGGSLHAGMPFSHAPQLYPGPEAEDKLVMQVGP
jgi:hypothetical protein